MPMYRDRRQRAIWRRRNRPCCMVMLILHLPRFGAYTRIDNVVRTWDSIRAIDIAAEEGDSPPGGFSLLVRWSIWRFCVSQISRHAAERRGCFRGS
jgi:hypothetical protein